MRDDLADLAAFAAIVEERSFTRAAARLGLSPSALSHALRGLERRLGIQLVQRTTRSVTPTAAGTALFDTIEPAIRSIANAVEGLGIYRDRSAGRVRISSHRMAAIQIVAPRLAELKRTHPDIMVELAVEDGLTDIVSSGFDCGIRPGEMIAKDMVAVRIGADQRFVVAGAPSYFTRNPAPVTPDDLSPHECLVFRYVTSGKPARWAFRKDDRAVTVDVAAGFITNDASLLIQAALDGVGLAYLLEQQIADHLASGALVTALHDWSVPWAGDFLYYPSNRRISPALKVVVDLLRHEPC